MLCIAIKVARAQEVKTCARRLFLKNRCGATGVALEGKWRVNSNVLIFPSKILSVRKSDLVLYTIATADKVMVHDNG